MTEVVADESPTSRKIIPGASTIPPHWCTDPAFFEAEQRLVFGSSWIPVARAGDLAEAGEYATFQLGDDPLVVVRDRTGELRAFPNVCRHRSTTIVEGAGSVPALQCPYHLWTWSLDGHLVGAPEMAGDPDFDRDAMCLPALRVEQWQGWVMVNLDADANPLAGSMHHLDRLLAPHDLPELVSGQSLHYESHVNWKVLVDNFAESYHHAGVHPETLQTTFPGQRSWVEDNHGEPWMWLDHVSLEPELEPFSVNVVFPMLLFSIVRGIGALWFRIQPTAVDHTILDIVPLLPPDAPAELAGLMTDTIGPINDEDVAINDRTQRGLRSRFAAAGPASELERGCWQFQQWLTARITAPDDRRRVSCDQPAAGGHSGPTGVHEV